jgi:hypothetical protein
MMTRTSRMIAAGFLVAAGVASVGMAVEADFNTPKGAFRTYTKALAEGDSKTLKEAVIASDKHLQLLDSQVAYTPVERKFNAAVVKSYPVAAKELADPSQEMLKAIDTADVKVSGESATLVTRLSTEPVKLKKVDNKWKLDLISMYDTDNIEEVMMFRKALADVMADMLPDVEAGKYKSFDEVKNTLEMRVKMRAALQQSDAPDGAATRPGK